MKFTTISTSLNSAKVLEPILIEELETTRRVFIAEINDVKQESQETVSGTLLHQRKKPNDDWEDIESIDLRKLKAGEGVKLTLDSEQLRKLYVGLAQLYKLSAEGFRLGLNEWIIMSKNDVLDVPEQHKEHIQNLLEANLDEDAWNELFNNDPKLASRLTAARINSERSNSVEEFELNLTKDSLTESDWQKFFEKNNWILGYGLKYCYLNTLTSQANYGGVNYTGKGTQKGDFLLNSEANIKYTVLVELKKPYTPLISRQHGNAIKYRNNVCLLSKELIGGVAQIQANCKSWQSESERTPNTKALDSNQIFTVQPKGILIIGNMKELCSPEEVETFELFRQNLKNPEIITYDELLERAKFIISTREINKEIEDSDKIIDF